MKFKDKIDLKTYEQIYSKNRYRAVDQLARRAGFDQETIDNLEFNLMPFFELIVEQCAQVAESQATNYDGQNNEGRGCYDSANAIRTFGKTIGNYVERKGIVK